MPQKYGLTGKQSFLYVTRTLCYVARMKNVLIFIKEHPKMLRHLKCVFRNNRMKLQNRHIATAPPMWQTVNSYLVRIRYFARSRDFPEIRDSRAVSPIPFDSESHSFPTKSPKKDHTNEAKRKRTGKGGSQSVTFCHSFSVGRITSNREKTCLGRTFPP